MVAFNREPKASVVVVRSLTQKEWDKAARNKRCYAAVKKIAADLDNISFKNGPGPHPDEPPTLGDG